MEMEIEETKERDAKGRRIKGRYLVAKEDGKTGACLSLSRFDLVGKLTTRIRGRGAVLIFCRLLTLFGRLELVVRFQIPLDRPLLGEGEVRFLFAAIHKVGEDVRRGRETPEPLEEEEEGGEEEGLT